MKSLKQEVKASTTTSDKDFADIFWRLSSAVIDEREAAANVLIAVVLNEPNKLSSSSSVNSKFSDQVDGQQSQDMKSKGRLQYCLERLFKGLAGQKPESKIGFSLALTLLLEKLSKSQIRSAFTTGEKCLLDMKVDSKQEASSKRIGACLLLLAATRSSAFTKMRPEQRTRALDAVASLLGDRGPADLAACALTGAIEQLSPDEFKLNLFTKLSGKLSCGWESLDANGLLLLLCCQQHQKDAVDRSFLKSHYATKHLISQTNFDHFVRLCLSTADDSHENLGGCLLHPGIERLLDCLLTKSPSLLSEFASSVAVATVANADSPASRKAIGLAVLAWIADCPAERFDAVSDSTEDGDAAAKAACLSDCLASEELCRQVRNHAANKNSLLHSFACRLLSKQLLPSSANDQPVLIAVANRLLGADCMFDDGLPADCRIIRADTLARMPVELLDNCASRIEAELATWAASSKQKHPGPDPAAARQRRRVSFGLQTLRQLVAGSRTLLSGKSKSCARILLSLADLFLLSTESRSDASVATDARSAFCRGLDSMSSAALSGGSAYRRSYRRCLRHLTQGLIDRLTPVSSKSSAVRRSLTLGLEMLQLAPAAGNDDQDEAAGSCGGIEWCFALAFLHLGFHMLPGAASGSSKGSSDSSKNASIDEASVDEASAQTLIDDLNECRRRSAAGDDDANSSGRASDGQPKWPDVLLDSLVGLLAASRSRLLRSVASLFARQIASVVTQEGVAALTQLLLEGDTETAEEGDDDEDGDEDEAGSDDEGENKNEAEADSDKESEISFSQSSDSDSDIDAVDADFRRACKSALGDAACPSDAEADVDPSDLSDSAMERVDQALSLAFRSQLGPSRRGERAAALERRRRRCQAKMRLLDLAEPLLLTGGPQCRLSLAACLAQLALLAVGGGGGGGSGVVNGGSPAASGGFWSAAPANERDQLRKRSLALLKRAAVASAPADQKKKVGDNNIDEELARAVEAALAANLKSPLPAKMAETAADILSALLRIRPSVVESRLTDALSCQLSPSSSSGRFRLGGLALWQRVCSERPQLLVGLRRRLLDLLTASSLPDESGGQQLKSHDLAAVASLAVCLVKSGDVEAKDGDFHRLLAEWTFERLDAETGPAGVTSAHLLAALLQLAAALLRRARLEQQLVAPSPGLADRLREIRSGIRSLDLRRALQACLAELAAAAASESNSDLQKKKKKKKSKSVASGKQKRAEQTATATDEVPAAGSAKKRRRVASAVQEESMDTD